MNDPVPSKPGIIHNNMDLAIPKLRSALYQFLDVFVI